VAMNNAHVKVHELLLGYKALRANVSKAQKTEIYRLQQKGILDIEYFHPSVLSSTYTATNVNNIYNKLRKQKGQKPIVIRFASNNPRNLDNLATKKEMELLEKFNSNEIDHYVETIVKDNTTVLYDVIPIQRTTSKCMKCHSTPDLAPKELITRYGDKNGFYEEKGIVRAILTTSYPLDEDLNSAFNVFLVLTTITFILLSILLYIIYLFMKRLEQSHNQIIQHEKNLKNLNKDLEQRIVQEVKKNTDIQKQLFKSEKMAAMGEMIGNIAHQWRQPLSVISTASTGMKMLKEFGTLNDEQFNKNCNAINTNAQYLSKTIDDFRNFIKGDSKSIKFNLKNNIDSFLKLVDSNIKNSHIDVILNLTEDVTIEGYPNELIQCLINIFNNAKDVLVENNQDEDRYIFVSQEIVKNNIVIKFKDNAGGIPKDVLPKIFEPYFTTKHQSQGTGLGLHMTYNLIVDGMGGTIEAENVIYKYNNKEFAGAEFTISLPLS